MADWQRHLGKRLLRRIDAWYRCKYGLQVLGPVLLLRCEPYRGDPREFSDGTRILERQLVGSLHFNNFRIAELQGGNLQSLGVRFARLFRESLHKLAEHAQSDPALKDVAVYQGVTWFRPHGRQVGFVSETLPPGLKRWWLASYFRILTWGFTPAAVKRLAHRWEPRRFWITRRNLIKHFGASKARR